jgi:predicted DNA-binding protein (MmcQ/YjbR family)
MADPLDRLRKIALALPEATEQMGFGHPVFYVRKKCFAAFESTIDWKLVAQLVEASYRLVASKHAILRRP